MIEPKMLLIDRNKAIKEMDRRGARMQCLQFFDLYDKLESEKLISPEVLIAISRQATLEYLDTSGGDIANIVNIYLSLPNFARSEVPTTINESDDVVLFEYFPKDKSSCPSPQPYHQFAEKKGILDKSLCSLVSEEGYPFLLGIGPELESALIQYMKDIHKTNGYKEISIPTVINESAMFGTGAFPRRRDDVYRIHGTNLYLNPTAEMQLTNMVRNKMFNQEQEFPLRYQGYARSFRRERGKTIDHLTTLHEFGKVELLVLTNSENEEKEYDLLINEVELVLQGLQIPYRRILLGTGNMGVAAAKTTDFDIYAPGTGKWLEISSCSMLSDFQTRRMNTTWNNPKTSEKEYLSTLHGSGTSIQRLIASILENYQTPDGRLMIPDKLKPYLGGREYI